MTHRQLISEDEELLNITLTTFAGATSTYVKDLTASLTCFSVLHSLLLCPVFKAQQHSYTRTSLPEKNNLFWGLVKDVKSQNKKKDSDVWVTPNSNTHPHTACVHTDLQRAEEEEAKGRLLPVPLGHLLTFSLDFSKFGLPCKLCDAFHADAFKEYGSLGGKQKAELGLEWRTPAPTHQCCWFPNRRFLVLSHCVETTGRKTFSLYSWPLFSIHLIHSVPLLQPPLGVIQLMIPLRHPSLLNAWISTRWRLTLSDYI